MNDWVPDSRTEQEAIFIRELAATNSELQWYPHDAKDGSPWLIVSYDMVVGHTILDTLRLDYDGECIRGGWSPAFLNWDDGVPAIEAGIELSPPDGIERHGTPSDLARIAAEWFADHIARWPCSERRARWKLPGDRQRLGE
ncbi:MAG: hypothetical protein M3169_03610 [Candidatus Eremiobacteraeota bacterium]|nr:hypothetical protein [Candidatus Eremiobacteraeota bacterium]